MKTLLYSILLVTCFSCSSQEKKTQKIEEESSSSFLTVDGRHLKTPCGKKVILRGVNEMFIWSNDRTGKETLPEIAKTGANCVRLVWTTQGDPSELDQLITNCIANKMIPIPELHDATGEIDGVPKIVDYWTSEAVVSVLKKHEAYAILNIANEAGGHEVKDSLFLSTYKKAVSRIRDTGIQSPIMIDASGWGQNTDILQANWKELQDYDNRHNLLFSVHTWWPKDSTSTDPGSTNKIIQEIAESVEIGMPLVVGEFAPMGPGCKQYFDYETLIRVCHENEIGWLSWSWGRANNGDCADMDITDGGIFGQWTQTKENGQWGEVTSVSSPYSIKNTSKRPDYILNGGCL